MKSIVENAQTAVRVGEELGEWSGMTVGTRQGDLISAITFIIIFRKNNGRN